MARSGAATADGGEVAADADAKPKGRSRKRLMIIGGAVVVLAVAAWQFGLVGGGGEDAEAMMDADGAPAPAAVVPASYYRMPEMVVNLAEQDRTAFARLRINLEYRDQAVAAAVEANMPRITDMLLTYMRELRLSDLSGTAAIFRLKDALLQRINLVIHPARIDDVLFEDILIQ